MEITYNHSKAADKLQLQLAPPSLHLLIVSVKCILLHFKGLFLRLDEVLSYSVKAENS